MKSVFSPELARKLSQALTTDDDSLFLFMQETTSEILQAALKNPNLREKHLQALLKRKDLSESLLKTIYKSELTGASHALKVALVKNPNTPGMIIQSLLPHLYLFELVAVCFIPGVTPDQKMAAERAIIKRLPNTELGNKMTLARRATPNVADALLKEGDTRLVPICLSNPRLKEVSILQFLNSAKSTAETISMIARHPKWKSRPNLKLAILKNNKTPPVWFSQFLPQLRTQDLNGLLALQRLNPGQKRLVKSELKKRGGQR